MITNRKAMGDISNDNRAVSISTQEQRSMGTSVDCGDRVNGADGEEQI